MLKRSIHNNIPVYRFTGLGSCSHLVHFISGREGGVSRGGQSSLNIGFTEEDKRENVLKNRQLLLSEVGVDLSTLTTGEQKHTTHVEVVLENSIGCGGRERETRLPETDALITALPEVCLMVLAADCVPILLYDTERHVIAAIHAGWRGTVGKITSRVVARMEKEFGCNPKDIRAGIGPSIGKCCFEVGEEVVEIVRKNLNRWEDLVESGENHGKYNFDLWEANRRELTEAGLCSGYIEVARICTVCNRDRFFSYRGDRGDTGRFGAGIMMKKKC